MNAPNQEPQGGTHIGNLNINAPNAPIQIGSHNLQQILTSIEAIFAAIDASPAPPEQKQEAKTRLQKFLAHPLTVSIIGNVAGQAVKTAAP